MTKEQKPIISTMINTTALLFTGAAGGLLVIKGLSWDYIAKAAVLTAIGVALEYLKYWGMKKKLW